MKDIDTIREDHDIGAHLPGDKRDTCAVCNAIDRVENEISKLHNDIRTLRAELRDKIQGENDELTSDPERE